VYKEYLVPISIKGIIRINGKYLLVKNNRNEWELPGGRLEPNELPEETLEREIYEELNIKFKVSKIVDSWVFEVVPNKTVFIVAYLIDANSIEHSNFGLFNLEELEHMDIPKGYLNSIKNIYIGDCLLSYLT